MKQTASTLRIKSIIFESNDPEIVVRGTVSKGLMHYESELIVSNSQLNVILNTIQKNNSDISVYDFIQSEPMYNGEQMYSADFSSLSQASISIGSIQGNEPLRQIRA